MNKMQDPRIEDRLPEADFIGKAYLLDLAKETSSMLYYNKIPYRDLLSEEYLLSKGKQYGLDIQKPVYFFGFENGNFGCLVPVTDSSKIKEGLLRLGKSISIEDSLCGNHIIYKYAKEKVYMAYGKDFLLFYRGYNVSKILFRVMDAHLDEIEPCWRAFLNEKQFKDEKLVVFSNWKKLKDNGLETAIFAHDSDSINFKIKAYLRNSKPLTIALKKDGKDLKKNKDASKLINLHLNIDKLRNDKSDPLYKYLLTLGKRISFPIDAFLHAWDGDLSFNEGGTTIQKETFIESVMDDNFNVQELKRVKEIKVPNYAVLLSMNKKGPSFIQLLLKKGILTSENNYYRFLFSPQLKMDKKKNYYLFYSGTKTPKINNQARNYGELKENGTNFSFEIDSLSTFEAFGSINIPAVYLIKNKKLIKSN
jgi:hypothetical protein